MKTVDELMDIAAIVRDQVNQEIFVFAWSAALISRPDTRSSLSIPPIWEIFPDKFIGKVELQLIVNPEIYLCYIIFMV